MRAKHSSDAVAFLARSWDSYCIGLEQNSLDLNPVDYKVWGHMQEKVCHVSTRHGRFETTPGWHIVRDAVVSHLRAHWPVTQTGLGLYMWKSTDSLFVRLSVWIGLCLLWNWSHLVASVIRCRNLGVFFETQCRSIDEDNTFELCA